VQSSTSQACIRSSSKPGFLSCAVARQHGDDDLAEDLTGIATLLQAALKAQTEGKPERRMAKLGEAQEALRRVAAGRGEFTDLAESVGRLE